MLLDAYLGPEEFTQWMVEETAATEALIAGDGAGPGYGGDSSGIGLSIYLTASILIEDAPSRTVAVRRVRP